MCYVSGSIDQATATCRACKAFKPSSGRCPHLTDTCRNRNNHPRGDVVYLKNAEAQCFNGCGFCKWARTNPPAKLSGYQNPGWPGCCRPPASNENRFINIADWPAVSIVHGMPIPLEAKLALEKAAAELASQPYRGHLRSPSQPSTLSRKTGSGIAANARGDTTPIKSTSLPIPSRSRGSPPQSNASLTSSRNESPSSSLPNASMVDQVPASRHPSIQTQVEKRRDSSRDTRNSPNRKHAELVGSVSRKGSVSRPSVTANYSPPYGPKLPLDAQPQPRRALVPNTNLPAPVSSAQPRTIERERNERDRERPVKSTAVRRERSPLDESFAAMSVNGDAYASSSDSGGSETTVISDGGFTDYLSDESEAELQRQAEVKAALIAQSHLEEQEFRAARQQLANIDLRPPKSWTNNIHTTPRSQNAIPAAAGMGSH